MRSEGFGRVAKGLMGPPRHRLKPNCNRLQPGEGNRQPWNDQGTVNWMNCSMSETTASGASAWMKCPTPGSVTTGPFGQVERNAPTAKAVGMALIGMHPLVPGVIDDARRTRGRSAGHAGVHVAEPFHALRVAEREDRGDRPSPVLADEGDIPQVQVQQERFQVIDVVADGVFAFLRRFALAESHVVRDDDAPVAGEPRDEAR